MNKHLKVYAKPAFGCKRPTAWIQEDNRLTKIATFTNDEAVELFAEFLREAGLIVKNYD